MKVLMVGVDHVGKGGMWTVVENYLHDYTFCHDTNLLYVPTASGGSVLRRVLVFAKGLLKIRKELRSGKYDIVHMHLSERGSLYRKNIIQSMAKKAKCKTILHMHGADFEAWYHAGNDKRKKAVRNVVSHADKVLILGHYWEEWIGSLMTDKSRLVLLYNAVDVPLKNTYSVKQKKIMFLGALIERKGILDLLAAMAKIRLQLPVGCSLLLCGDDPKGIVAFAIKQLGVQDIVELKGWINAKQKEQLMSECAINVLPSYREGLPMTILESMAHGLPNVSTTIAAIPEAIDNGENGLLIEPGNVELLADAILTLMNDDKLRMRFSEVAYDRAKKHFSLTEHNKRLLKIYKELL